MFDPLRHVPLCPLAWDADEARSAIGEIVADAFAHFDPEGFWPAHPLDEGQADGEASVYFGASGVVWALDYLARVGAVGRQGDLGASVPHLLATSAAQFAGRDYAGHGSFLFGTMGAGLVAMRLAPSGSIADGVFARAAGNSDLPIRELMWGMPGSMLACVHMSGMTGEARWRGLFERQAARLLGDLEDFEVCPLWTQDLYGRRRRWLGPVHGYAGNMVPLISMDRSTVRCSASEMATNAPSVSRRCTRTATRWLLPSIDCTTPGGVSPHDAPRDELGGSAGRTSPLVIGHGEPHPMPALAGCLSTGRGRSTAT